jgi:hypothetical protein
MVAAWKGDTFKQAIKRYRTALSGRGTTAIRERSAGRAAGVSVAFCKTHSFLNRRSHVRVMPGSPANKPIK